LKQKKFLLFLVLFLSLISCVVGCNYSNGSTNQLPAQQPVANTPQIEVTSKTLTEPTSSISWEKVEKTEPAKAEPAANPQPKEELATSRDAETVPPLADYFITINLDSNRLTLFKNGVKFTAYSIASGRISYETGRSLTPTGKFVVLNKEFNPTWVKYEGATPVPGGDPSNPLGHYWLGTDAKGGLIGVHGNADESSIGTYASSGCIRMHNSEVPQLYALVPIGTPVWIGYADQLTSWDVKGFE